MSVKKILLLGAAAVAAVSMSAAMAGGFTNEPGNSSMMSMAPESSFYVEANGGWAIQNYYDDAKWNGQVGTQGSSSNHNNSKGGFTGGVDLGMNFNRNLGLELGYFHLPDVNVATTGQPSTYLTSWVLYLAAKYMMPISWINNTGLYFKLGAAYRRANISSAEATSLGVTTTESSYVRPMFATGLDCAFTNALYGVIQYAFFMGAQNSFPLNVANAGAYGTVAANVLTLGLGYKFTV